MENKMVGDIQIYRGKKYSLLNKLCSISEFKNDGRILVQMKNSNNEFVEEECLASEIFDVPVEENLLEKLDFKKDDKFYCFKNIKIVTVGVMRNSEYENSLEKSYRIINTALSEKPTEEELDTKTAQVNFIHLIQRYVQKENVEIDFKKIL